MQSEKNPKFNFKIFGLVYVVFFVSFVLFFFSVIPLNTHNEVVSEVKPIALEGTYSNQLSGRSIPFQDASKIPCSGWREIFIDATVTEEVLKGTEIMFFVYQDEMDMFVNDELIYSSGEDELSRWDAVVSTGIQKGDRIQLHMSQKNQNLYQDSFHMTLSRLYQGNRYGLLQKEIMHNMWTIVLSLLIFVTGLSVVLATTALLLLKVRMLKGYLPCGMLMVVGGACCFINYDYITLLFPYPLVINLIDYSLQVGIAFFLVVYMKSFTKEKTCRRITNVTVSVWTLFMAIYFSMCSFRIESIITINGVLLLSALIVIMIILMVQFVDYYLYGNIQAREVLFSGFLLTICTTIEMIHYYITHIWWINLFLVGVAGFTIFQLWVLLKHSMERVRKVEKAKQLEKDFLTSRINQMSHQIRPHFVYNVMTTISCLCEENPVAARDMADNFSDYLRANVDAMNLTRPIPFQREIRNMNVYYALEQIRFQNKMEITWQLEEEQFEIPALTIEPLVENAIKHGVNYKDGILHILVATKKYEDYIEVIVKDDGPGFDPEEKKNDGREHVGLMNVRKRLEFMSHADMSIESEIGKGTKVTIRIPWGKWGSEHEDTGN